MYRKTQEVLLSDIAATSVFEKKTEAKDHIKNIHMKTTGK